MARRRAPEPPAAVDAVFPDELRRGNVVIEDFVPPWEQPPAYWSAPGGPGCSDASWRSIRALRRWQDAVEKWGGEHGLHRSALMKLGLWPTRPPGSVPRPNPGRPQ